MSSITDFAERDPLHLAASYEQPMMVALTAIVCVWSIAIALTLV